MSTELSNDEIIIWVCAHPGCTSADVAEAFETTPKVVGGHLSRAAMAGKISQHETQSGRARFVYGPALWAPLPMVSQLGSPTASPVYLAARQRLGEVRAALHALLREEAVLKATVDAYEGLDDEPIAARGGARG